MEAALKLFKMAVLRASAKRLGAVVSPKLDVAGAARVVTEALKAKHPTEMEKFPSECAVCGFVAPDTAEFPSCLACGVNFDGPAEPVAKDAEAPSEPEPKKKKDKEPKADAAPAPQSAPATPAPAPKEPEVLTPPPSAKDAERELDRHTEAILRMRTDLALNAWDIGQALSEVHDHDLWKVRHRSFADYCENVCGFSRQTGMDFRAIAKQWTREQAGKLPVSHLRLLARAPEEKRAELTARAEAEQPTKRELAKEVKHARTEAGLETERRGLEKTTMISTRVRPGVVSKFKWSAYDKKSAKAKGAFKLGDVVLYLETDRAGGVVKYKAPRPGSDE